MQIGRDPRLSGAALQAGLTAGLASQQVQVAQFDLATTPAMFMSCIIGGADLHLPTKPRACRLQEQAAIQSFLPVSVAVFNELLLVLNQMQPTLGSTNVGLSEDTLSNWQA